MNLELMACAWDDNVLHNVRPFESTVLFVGGLTSQFINFYETISYYGTGYIGY